MATRSDRQRLAKADFNYSGLSVRSTTSFQQELNREQQGNRDKFRFPSFSAVPSATPNLDVGGFLRSNPEGSLGDIVASGDTFISSKDRATYVVEDVGNRKLTARRVSANESEGATVGYVVERDANGQPVGLREKGVRPPNRAVFG